MPVPMPFRYASRPRVLERAIGIDERHRELHWSNRIPFMAHAVLIASAFCLSRSSASG
jgi:hypothetical protein